MRIGFDYFSKKSIALAFNSVGIEAPLPSFGKKQTPLPLVVPPISAHSIRTATVANYGYYSSFAVNKEFALPWRYENTSLDLKVGESNSWIKAHRGQQVLLGQHGKKVRLTKAIYAGSRSPGVWAHWLVNYLPTVYLARNLPNQYDSFPVLVPTNIPEDSHWTESLEVILAGRPKVEFDRNTDYIVEELICFDPAPVYDLPFARDVSARRGIWFYPDVMEDFRQTLLHWAFHNSESNLKPHRRIFIARGGDKRPFNQDETASIAAEFGFETFFVEALSLAEKIRLFYEADYIIGPGGSGMANVMFCRPGASVFSWWDSPLKTTDNFDANLAKLSGAMFKMASRESITRFDGGRYILDGDYLRKALSLLTTERETRFI